MSRAIYIALLEKIKVGFIDGSITPPPSSDLNLFNAWSRNNGTVISWILNYVSKDIAASLLYTDKAKDMCDDLRKHFKQSNGPRLFQMQQNLIKTKQDRLSISQYFTKLKIAWDEITSARPMCSCGKCICGGVKQLSNHYQNEYLMFFLMSLNENFSHLRAQLLMTDPLPTLSRAFALASQEECQQSIRQNDHTSLSTVESVFASKVDFSPHSKNNSHNYRKKPHPIFSHCNVPGHTKERCYKLHGYPPGYKPKPRSSRREGIHTNVVQTDVPEGHTFIEPSLALGKDQIQHIMHILSQQLQLGNNSGTKSTDSFVAEQHGDHS